MSTLKLLNRTKAAEILGVDRRTLINWQKQGILQPSKFENGRPYYTMDQLIEYNSSTSVANGNGLDNKAD